MGHCRYEANAGQYPPRSVKVYIYEDLRSSVNVFDYIVTENLTSNPRVGQDAL